MSLFEHVRDSELETLLANPYVRVFYCPRCGNYFAVPRGGPVCRCPNCGYPHVVRVDVNRGWGWRGGRGLMYGYGLVV